MKGILSEMRNKRFRVIFCITIYLWLGEGCVSVWAQSAQRPLILGISHVAFRVKDLTKAKYFYQDFLGYKATRINKGDNYHEHINFRVNDRQHIEVYSGLPAEQDERMLEVAFQITDAEAMRLYLLGKGVKVPGSLSKGREGALSFVVEDPERQLIKFIQYPWNKKTNRDLLKKQKELAISDRILHVGITVTDVKSADAFYQDILGFSEIWRGGRPDNVTNWINMRVPEGTDYVEYVSYRSGK